MLGQPWLELDTPPRPLCKQGLGPPAYLHKEPLNRPQRKELENTRQCPSSEDDLLNRNKIIRLQQNGRISASKPQ